MDFTVGFVSRNLVTQKNFIEFLDSRIFSIFGASGVRWTPKTEFLRKKISKVKYELLKFILK